MSDTPQGGGVGPDGEGERPVVRDRRRFDPETGERRADIPDALSPSAPADPVVDAASADKVAELTEDLQRVQAEFANYRRRVERDRQAVGEAALASVMVGLLPVLDDLDRARAHGEVEGGFALVADGLEATLTKLGLSRFGDPGEPFDPTVHEALTHGHSADVSEPVCAEIYQPGYRVGERVLRPARVAVLEPEAGGENNDN
ncbi:MAG: nucleotide exchange factor GrpE [Mycobacteriales bacterium]